MAAMLASLVLRMLSRPLHQTLSEHLVGNLPPSNSAHPSHPAGPTSSADAAPVQDFAPAGREKPAMPG